MLQQAVPSGRTKVPFRQAGADEEDRLNAILLDRLADILGDFLNVSGIPVRRTGPGKKVLGY